MSDSDRRVEIDIEADASQAVRGVQKLSTDLGTVINQIRQIERNLGTSSAEAVKMMQNQTAELVRQLQLMQELPQRVRRAFNEANRQIASGGPEAALANAQTQGFRSQVSADPSVQRLDRERQMNRLIQARYDTYRRMRELLPDGAMPLAQTNAYRQALQAINDQAPERGTSAYRNWMERTRRETRRFEEMFQADRLENIRRETEARTKANDAYLRDLNRRNQAELRMQRTQQAELMRLFRNDMNAIRGGATPEERRQLATEAINNLRDYHERRGGSAPFPEQRLNLMFLHEEDRIISRPTRQDPNSPEARAARAARQHQGRDDYMNYLGGAPALEGRFGFLRDFALIGGVMGTLGYAATSVTRLQTSMRQLQAISQSTNIEMQGLQRTIFSVGQTTNFSTDQIAQAATVLAQAGYSVQQIQHSLPAIANLATASGSGLEDTVAVVTSVLSIYDMSIQQSTQVSNQLAEALNGSKLNLQQLSLGIQYAGNIAAQGGVQFDELTAALGAMSNAGIRSGSTLGTGLRTLLENLQNPSTRLREQLTALHISLEDINLQSQGFAGVIENLTRGGFRNAQAFAALDQRAAAAFVALQNNLPVFQQLQSDLQDTTAATDAAAVQMDSFQSQFQRLGNAFTQIVTVGGAPLLGMLQAIAGGLASVLTSASALAIPLQAIFIVLQSLVITQTVRWLAGLAQGMIQSAMAAQAAALATEEASVATLTFGEAMTVAATQARAFGVALLTTPTGWFTLGLTTLTAIFGGLQFVQSQARQQVEQFAAEANQAASNVQDLNAKVSQLNGFAETLINRYGRLSQGGGELAATVENATARFGAWGDAMRAQIGTVDELISHIVTLRREMAGEALDAARIQRTAIVNERSALLRSGVSQAWVDIIRQSNNPLDRNRLAPLLQAMLDGTATVEQLNQLQQLAGNIPAGTGPAGSNVLRGLQGFNFPRLRQLQRQVAELDQQISAGVVAASTANESIGQRTLIAQGQYNAAVSAANRITDPRTRLQALRTAREQERASFPTIQAEIDRQIASLLTNREVASGAAIDARRRGITPQEVVRRWLIEGNPQIASLSVAAGDPNVGNDPGVLRAAISQTNADLRLAQQARDQNEIRRLNAQLTDYRQRLAAATATGAGGSGNPDAEGAVEGLTAEEQDARARQEVEAAQRATSRIQAGTLRRRADALWTQIAGLSAATPLLPTTPTIGRLSTEAEVQALVRQIAPGVRITSGLRTPSQNRGVNGAAHSYHLTGHAIDMAPLPGRTLDDFVQELRANGLNVIEALNETANSPHSTGPHWHIAWADSAPSTTPAQQQASEQGRQALLAQIETWKNTRRQQLRAQLRASGADPADVNQQMADLEIELNHMVDQLLGGNIADVTRAMSERAKQSAELLSSQTSNALRQGGDLDRGLQQINTAWQEALDATIAAEAAQYSAQHQGVDPNQAVEFQRQRQRLIQEFAGKTVDAALAAVEAFFQGEEQRRTEDVQLRQSQIEDARMRVNQLSNYYGNRNLGDTHRALGQIDSRNIDIQERRNALNSASADFRAAQDQRDALQTLYWNTNDPAAQDKVDEQIQQADQHIAQMRQNLEQADREFRSITETAAPFNSLSEAINASWAAFFDQMQMGRPIFEKVADGLTNAFQRTTEAFGQLVTDVVTGSKSMGEAIKSFALTVVQALLDMAAKILAEQIIMWVLSMFTGGGGGVAPGAGISVSGAGASVPMPIFRQGGVVRAAQGVAPFRDSVHALLMPGEGILNVDAMRMMGEDRLREMNQMGNRRYSEIKPGPWSAQREPDQVHVYVVAPEVRPPVGKKDIVVAITEDMLKNGHTKQLVKAIAMGMA